MSMPIDQQSPKLEKKAADSSPGEPPPVWPPAPRQPRPNVLYMGGYGGELITGINWIDAVLGVPCGFFIAFILWAVSGIIVQAIYGLPTHRPQMLAISASGILSSAIAYVLIGRKFSLFGATMWIGGSPMFLLLLFFAFWSY